MLPRQVLPRQLYLITRRCTQRQFLLRPETKATNNGFLYCLIDAARRCEIDLLLPCAMSNHDHVDLRSRRSLPGVHRAFSQAPGSQPERPAWPLGELVVVRVDASNPPHRCTQRRALRHLAARGSPALSGCPQCPPTGQLSRLGREPADASRRGTSGWPKRSRPRYAASEA